MSYSQLGGWQPWDDPEFEEFLKTYYSRRLIIAGHIAPDDDAARLIIFEKIASPSVYLETQWEVYSKKEEAEAPVTQRSATTPTAAPRQRPGDAAPEKSSFASLRWRRIGTGVKDDRFSGPRDDGWVFRDQREAKYKPIVADLIERLLLEDGPIQIYIGAQLFKVELTGQEFGFIQRRPIDQTQKASTKR